MDVLVDTNPSHVTWQAFPPKENGKVVDFLNDG
jgi:hypothetical protein